MIGIAILLLPFIFNLHYCKNESPKGSDSNRMENLSLELSDMRKTISTIQKEIDNIKKSLSEVNKPKLTPADNAFTSNIKKRVETLEKNAVTLDHFSNLSQRIDNIAIKLSVVMAKSMRKRFLKEWAERVIKDSQSLLNVLSVILFSKEKKSFAYFRKQIIRQIVDLHKNTKPMIERLLLTADDEALKGLYEKNADKIVFAISSAICGLSLYFIVTIFADILSKIGKKIKTKLSKKRRKNPKVNVKTEKKDNKTAKEQDLILRKKSKERVSTVKKKGKQKERVCTIAKRKQK